MRLRLNRKSSVSLVANYWWSALVALIAILIVAFLLTYKLGTLTPGFSDVEIMQRAESANIITEQNPLFFVQNVTQFISQKLNHFGPVAMRLAGVMIAGVVVFGFYSVVASWYTKRMALIGVATIATSSWFLHTARLASHDVVFLMLFLLFAFSLWLQHARTSRMAIAFCVFTVICLLYVPGMVWFLLPMAIWQRRRIRNIAATLSLWQLLAFIVLLLLATAPLVLAVLNNHQLITVWLGVPADMPTLKEFANNLLRIPSQLFWRGPADPARWLGRLPLLDWFQVAMLVMGLYAYRFKLRLDRTWFLIYVLVIGSALIALKGPVSIALLLPFIYLLMVGGIALMLQQWFTVFPRNPFARPFGVAILSLALLMSCTYQLSHYFVAWPNTPETKAAFQYRP